MTNNSAYSIYIDGFTHESGEAGLGVLLLDEHKNEVSRISEPVGKINQDQAGFRAFMRALKELRQRRIDNAFIYAHNDMVVRQIQGIYKIMDPIVKQLKRAIQEQFGDLKFKVQLISATENKEATRLAQDAANKSTESQQQAAGFGAGFGSMPLRMTTEAPPPVEEEKKAIAGIQRSAGGILYKKDGQRIKICLIAKRGKTVWALPKGRVNEGEVPEQTALREVAEETGHLAEIQSKLDEIDYHFYWKDNNTFYHKYVFFYLMILVQENIQERDMEADDVIWLTPGEAYKKATYINEKEVIKKAKKVFDTMNI